MARSTISTSGFKDLERALAELPDNIGKAVARRTMKKAGEDMAEEQRRLAPVDDGKYRDSISAKVSTKNIDGLAEYGQARRSGGSRKEASAALRAARREAKAAGTQKGHRISVEVGPNSPLSYLIEFGSGERHHKSGKSTGVMPASPVVRPAFDNGVAQSIGTIKAGLEQEISAATKRIARKAARR